jgi:hypothetical protein
LSRTADKACASTTPMKNTLIDRRALRERWQCTIRTIRRVEKAHGLQAVAFVGNEPVYSLDGVLSAERKWTEHKRRSLTRCGTKQPAKVITVAEAKRLAKQGKRAVR